MNWVPVEPVPITGDTQRERSLVHGEAHALLGDRPPTRRVRLAREIPLAHPEVPLALHGRPIHG